MNCAVAHDKACVCQNKRDRVGRVTSESLAETVIETVNASKDREALALQMIDIYV